MGWSHISHTILEIVGTREQKTGEKQSAHEPAPLFLDWSQGPEQLGISTSLESLERPVGETRGFQCSFLYPYFCTCVVALNL